MVNRDGDILRLLRKKSTETEPVHDLAGMNIRKIVPDPDIADFFLEKLGEALDTGRVYQVHITVNVRGRKVLRVCSIDRMTESRAIVFVGEG